MGRKTGSDNNAAETAAANGKPNAKNPDTAAAAETANTTGGRSRKRKPEAEAAPEIQPVLIEPTTEPTEPLKIPARKKSTGSAKELAVLSENLSMVLIAGFSIAGGMVDREIWQISTPEADSIAQPLARILQQQGSAESVNKYADYIVLLGAVSLVAIPRVMLTMEKKKYKKAQGVREVSPNVDNSREIQNASGSSDRASRGEDNGEAANDESIVSVHADVLPPLGE